MRPAAPEPLGAHARLRAVGCEGGGGGGMRRLQPEPRGSRRGGRAPPPSRGAQAPPPSRGGRTRPAAAERRKASPSREGAAKLGEDRRRPGRPRPPRGARGHAARVPCLTRGSPASLCPHGWMKTPGVGREGPRGAWGVTRRGGARGLLDPVTGGGSCHAPRDALAEPCRGRARCAMRCRPARGAGWRAAGGGAGVRPAGRVRGGGQRTRASLPRREGRTEHSSQRSKRATG